MTEIKNKYTKETIFVFEGESLIGANLTNANLRGADLNGADLRGADLSDAYLHTINLSYADLRDADLRDADLRGADLTDADLTNADLTDADLTEVLITGVKAIGPRVRSIPNIPYHIAWTKDQLAIGCKQKSFTEWEKLTTTQIDHIDPAYSLEFFLKQWPLIKPFVYATREQMQ